MLEVTKLATESQISRPTVTNWLEMHQITHVAHLVRPFSAGGRREIVAQPKVTCRLRVACVDTGLHG